MEYIIFGASNAGKSFAEMRQTIPIAYFCDNSEKKWDTIFCGKKVISPATLLQIYNPFKYTVMIASMYGQEIGIQLQKMGIERFCFYKIETMTVREGFSKEEYDVLPFLEKYTDENGHFRWDGVPFENAEKLQYKREVTILIPTYKRPQLLKQAITYYGSINNEELGIRLIILDASPEVTQAEIIDFIKDIPRSRVCMQCFPENANPWVRLCSGIQTVETEYCALCADDDFLFHDGLIKSVDFLEKNIDYFAAQGNNYLFSERMNNFQYDELASPQESISADEIDLRIKQWRHYCQVYIYMTYRTNEWQKKMHKFLEKYEVMEDMNMHFQEYLYYLLVLSLGKIGAIKSKWGFRDTTPLAKYLTYPTIYDTTLDRSFLKNIEICWNVYNYIFPDVSKERFLNLIQHMIETVILGKKEKESPLDADDIKRAFENSKDPFWSAHVETKRKKREA